MLIRLVVSVTFSNSTNSSWTPKGAFSISKVRVIFWFGANSWITPLARKRTFPCGSVVSNCQAPCLRPSNLRTFVPIHCSSRAGSTCARKSSSRGRSNSRVIEISCLPGSAVTFVLRSILVSFGVLFHDRFQCVEPLFPHGAERFNEVGDFFHFGGVDVVINLPAVLLLGQQFTFGEDLQVFGNRRPGGVKVRGDRAGRHRLGSNQQ